MKDEIKEILEDIKRHLDYVEETKQASIRDNEIKAIYDYITNLQDRIDKAIEYIKANTKNDTFCEWYDGEVKDLLNILQGKSDE